MVIVISFFIRAKILKGIEISSQSVPYRLSPPKTLTARRKAEEDYQGKDKIVM